MNTAELTALLDRLRTEPRETEWLEFKSNRYEPQLLGEYLCALANTASLLGKPRAYLVFGIEDGTHAIVGTTFDPAAEKGTGNQLLPLWLSLGLQPNIGFESYTFNYDGKRVVLFEINPAFDRPVKFYGKAYIRDGTPKTELIRKHQPVTREYIDAMLLDKLPEVLSQEQRLKKIHNLLYELSHRQMRIKNSGSRRFSQWVLLKEPANKQ